MLFQSLPIRDFSPVSRLPDRFRRGVGSAWADLNLEGRELAAFLEGPVCDAAGNLYVTDIPFGRIFRLDPAGEWALLAEYDGWPNGMKLDSDGNFLVADHKRGLVLIDRDTGTVSTLCAQYEGRPFYGLNDLTLGSDGTIYFTDQGQSGLDAPYGRVFRFTAPDRLDLLMDGIPSPNGLVLSSDGRVLYVAVTRANAIWRLPMNAEGRVVKAGLFIQMSGGIGPDGVVRTPDGRGLVVAHPGLGVWHFAPDGLPRALWRSQAVAYPTNLTADPRDPSRYLITDSMTAAVVQIDVESDA